VTSPWPLRTLMAVVVAGFIDGDAVHAGCRTENAKFGVSIS